MTDDAELRARIEAQVAARRAGASPSTTESDVTDEDRNGDTTASADPAPLAPVRPWNRTPAASQPIAPKFPSTPGRPVGRGPLGRRGIVPARPWERGTQGTADSPSVELPATELPTTNPSETGSGAGAAPEPAVPPAAGGLEPVRPWSGRRAPGEQAETESAPLAPSNPDVVLRALGAESPATDPAAGAATDGNATEYPWQRKGEVDLDLHGAPTWDPSLYPPEPDSGDGQPARRALRWLFARAPEPAGEESRTELAGVPPVAEPVTYVPVRDAIAAEPDREPAAANGSHGLELPSATALDIELPDELDEGAAHSGAPVEPQHREVDDVEQAVENAAASRRSPVSRLLGRRRQADDSDDEIDEQFELPAPDAAFERPWLRSETLPRPTRDWSRPVEPEPEPGVEVPVVAEPVDVAAPVQEAAPAAAHAGSAEGDVARPLDDLAPAPEAVPVPAAHRPTPAAPAAGAAAAPRRRPSPGPRTGTRSAPDRPKPRPRPGRPAPPAAAAARPGISGVTTSPGTTQQSGLRLGPFERSAVAAAPAAPADGSRTIGANHQPDLSRFLDATEPRPDDDVKDAKKDRDGDNTGGGGRLRRVFIRGFVIVAIAALAAMLLRTFVVQPYYIPSASMEPTLHGCAGCNDDHVLVDKVSYRAHDVRTGDIVVFDRPKGVQVPEKVLIKRVIALAGDQIGIKKGRVLVNGLVLEEPYLNKDKSCYAHSPDENFAARTVPKGDVFVMGDNRCDSTDSRDFGAIPTSSIVGRAFAIIWPLGRMRLL